QLKFFVESCIFHLRIQLQPYVENAIHHGLISANRPGHIHLNFSIKERQFLTITIEDNGIGREKALAIKREKRIKNESMGMKITQKRIQLIENIYTIKTEVSVEDLTHQNGQAKGTKVVLQIPLIHSKNLNRYVKSN
ncbi:MAG: ATP-binding protein, partial [Bacteroidota bacterium]